MPLPMLGLHSATDSRWVDAARLDLAGLLSDHAHCELKAATSALSIVSRFGAEHPALVEPLTALALEETEHFRSVHDHLQRRAETMHRPDADAYVNDLWNQTKAERSSVPLLLDRLLVNALIEARSCERFKLLSERLEDPELQAFYRELMGSEARHYRLFCQLAERLFGADLARTRLAQLAPREAKVASALPLAPRIHG